MPVPKVASVTLISSSTNGQQYSNTFHVENPGLGAAPDITALTGLANDIDTYFRSSYLAVLANIDTLNTITVRQVPDPAVPNDVYLEYQKAIAAAGTRTRTGSTTPYSACAVVQFRTPVASRRYRGHNFAPPALCGDWFATNQLATSGNYWTALNAWIAKLATGCSPTATWTGSTLSSYFLCIYSKAATLAGAPAVATCTAVTLNPQVRWLRSRERGTT